MTTNITAEFNDPSVIARYLGESTGTHYSVALRAAEAYGRHLATDRDALRRERFDGESLGEFWRALLQSEQVRIGSLRALKQLSTRPEHYFSDFLETADAEYRKRYEDIEASRKGRQWKTEHAQCLRFLREHSSGKTSDHLAVRNKIQTWMQLLRITGRYRD
jgi:hypothetical protein